MAAQETIPKDPAKVARILKASLHAFAIDGYAGAKTETIAATAKVSKGLIFHYFGSKQQLYLATVEHTMTSIMDEIMPEFQTPPADLVTLVVQGTKYKTAFGEHHPDEMALLIAAYGEIQRLPVKLQTQITKLYTESLKVTQRLIEQILDQMEVRPTVDRATAVDLIVGVYNQLFAEFQQHMQQQADIQSMADAQWLVERAKAYMDIIERGLMTSSKD